MPPAGGHGKNLDHVVALHKMHDVEQVRHHAGMVGQHAKTVADGDVLAVQADGAMLFRHAGDAGAGQADDLSEIGLAEGVGRQRL